jgi:hypothetical protein
MSESWQDVPDDSFARNSDALEDEEEDDDEMTDEYKDTSLEFVKGESPITASTVLPTNPIVQLSGRWRL